ncbi:anti-sigma factor domain-containing protein [Sporosarcina sp. Te-1]|uniref:anti-sigma-I factor RsgI family protein n=1 Tax=Sporosarcina sp. Te-1 TaxID=2818390 RepID=UPI001A9E2F43|nr:anti-sigma factor domain-containing protein [Sporosarcina sp. Te-1]QTD41057.1 anti-sigma factor domain-containing protein [Sporosarcina sp. Te-1]
MMRTNRGIVCEKKTAYTVFLTNEGNFVRGYPIGDSPEIGQEVEFHQIKTFCFPKKPLLYGPVFAVAMLLVILFASLYPGNEKALAYVQVESMTALEFGVDQHGTVVDYHQFGDPQKLLSETMLSEWVGLPIHNVLGKATREITDGNSAEELVVTLVYEDSKKSEKMKDIMNHAIKTARSSQQEVNLKVVESSEQERIQAKKRDTSIQQYKKQQDIQSKTHSFNTAKKQEAESEKKVKKHNAKQIQREQSIQPQTGPEVRQNGQKNTNKDIIEKEPSENNPSRGVAEKRQNHSRKTEPVDTGKEIKSNAQKNPAGKGKKTKNPESQNHPGKGNQKGKENPSGK